MKQYKWRGHSSETKYHRSAVELTAIQFEIFERRETDAKMEEKEKRRKKNGKSAAIVTADGEGGGVKENVIYFLFIQH